MSPKSVNSDEWFENIIGGIEDSMISGGYDNIALPSGSMDFTIRIGFIDQRGTATFGQGFLQGMQTIRRSSSISITPLPAGELRVEGNMVIPRASITYGVSASFMGVGHSFTVSGTVTNVAMKLAFTVTSNGEIKDVQFTQSGSGIPTFNVNGLPAVLNPITAQLTNWVGETVARQITVVIQQTIGSFIGQALADTLFPIPPPSPYNLLA